MELVASEEGIDELPVSTVRYINPSDISDFFEEFLRIEELVFGSYIIEISILDDLFEMIFWF